MSSASKPASSTENPLDKASSGKVASEKVLSGKVKSATVSNTPDIEIQFEQFAKEQSAEFDKIASVMKSIGNMFLFGEPTQKMIFCLLKIYHENIMKINYKNTLQKTNDILKTLNSQCMFGLMEDQEGNLYATISEDPADDQDYYKKRNMMYSVLLQSNMIIQRYDEDDAKYYNNGQGIPNTTFNPIYWRSYKGEPTFKNVNGIKTIDHTFDKPSNKEVINQYVFSKHEEVTDYPAELRDKKTIRWIDSWKYLESRHKGKSFSPFKRYKGQKEEKTYQIFCNNGSTCTEAKLFGYCKLHNIKPKSCIAYWIGNTLPPDHILKSYCFDSTIPHEKKQLEDLANTYKSYISRNIKKYDNALNEKIQYALQPFALACPGCLANMQKYKNSVQKEDFLFNKWNYTQCYKKRTTKIIGGRNTRNNKVYRIRHTRKLKK